MLSFKRYASETDGNVAVMFAVTALTLVVGTGVALDYSSMSRAQSALQSQVDAGVLAAATVEIDENSNEAQTKKQRLAVAREVVEANGFDLNGIDPVLTVGRDSITLRAEMDYKLSFGSVLGLGTKRVAAEAESGLGKVEGVDIVLVLDNTESMNVDGKMDALKLGATNLVDAIEYSGSESKMGIVPFARYVALKDELRTASWLDVPAEYDTPQTWTVNFREGGTCVKETQTQTIDGVDRDVEVDVCTGYTLRQEERSGVKESRWEGCVGTRIPPYSERDDSYSNKIPGLLNVIPLEVSGLGHNVNSYCPSAITEMTNDYDVLRDDIQRMWTTDYTYLPIGLVWGNRVLSPGEPFNNTPPASGEVNRKIMVLMTDGVNTLEIDQSTLAQDEFRAPPFISNIAHDAIATEANAATLRICNNAKAEGTEIYTIAFQVTDGTTQSLLRKCASSNQNAMTAESNSALVAVFENIANSMGEEVRLMR